MDLETIARLKLECFKIIYQEHKGENKSIEFLTSKATDLFNWLVTL